MTLEKVADRWRSRELYPCAVWCGVGTPVVLPQRRAELRCALPGFPERDWAPVPTSGYYMGGLPVYEGPGASDEPHESHDEGCPGAWYRCGFVLSLLAYERAVSEHGVYSDNPLLRRCKDPLVLEAIQYFELERARASRHMREAMNP